MQILDDYAERLETARQLNIKPRTASTVFDQFSLGEVMLLQGRRNLVGRETAESAQRDA